MNIVIFGGAGFVGLNIAAAALARGDSVTLFDRREPHPEAMAALRAARGSLRLVAGDVRDSAAVKAAVPRGTDLVIMGAAITAGPEREAADAATILSINLVAQVAMLEAARDAGARRVINLSSAAAYGAEGERASILTEEMPADPLALYGITKFTSERVAARLGKLWGLDVVSARLSGVFGPFEHDTGVRDTLSPLYQVLTTLDRGGAALLPRPGLRDWTYATDIAEAVLALGGARTLARPIYNISTGQAFSVLDFGQALAKDMPGAICRLAGPGEAPTIDLFGPVDRAPMSAAAIAADVGWRARFDMAAAVADLAVRRRSTPSGG